MLRILGGEAMPEKEILPTPSWGLNYMLDGGLWTGRFHILWGNPSSGKTTLFLQTMAEAQKLGYTPIIIDAEGSYTDKWGEMCGIDISKRVYYRTNIVNELVTKPDDKKGGMSELEFIDKNYEKYIILVDSLNALLFQDFWEGKYQIASDARARRRLFLSLANYLDPTRNAVFAVAQQTTVDLATRARKAANIGTSEEHWATNIIKLNNPMGKDSLERDKDSETIINKQIAWTIQKCKQRAVEGTKGNYWFHIGEAKINMVNEAVDIAVRNGVIQKKGSWFNWKGAQFQGLPNLINALTEEDLECILIELDQKEELVFDVEEEKTIELVQG